MPDRPRVLTFLSYYLPGYKAGGPLRTVSAMVDRIGDAVDFRIYCLDRDDGDTRPYPEIPLRTWTPVGVAQVFYAPAAEMGLAGLRRTVRAVEPDHIYLNSFFSPLSVRYLFLRRFGLTQDHPVVLAPRGELSDGALAIKSGKKRSFAWLATKVLRLYDGVTWQASSPAEAFEIATVAGQDARILVAPDLPAVVSPAKLVAPTKPGKEPGQARFAFCSRIAAKKNLHFLFPLLAAAGGRCSLDVYGPESEPEYAAYCRKEAQAVADRVTIRFHGAVPNERVAETLAQAHFFALPTLGENFGHALLEGFLAGCPVLVSDRTPWRDLSARNVGWSLPLEDRDAWLSALRECVAMDHATFTTRATAAHRFGADYVMNPPLAENLRLFSK